MSEIFVQKEGNGVGNEVELVKEQGNDVILCSIKTRFVYSLSTRDFQKMYERKEDANN
jgi:hypothetical protein